MADFVVENPLWFERLQDATEPRFHAMVEDIADDARRGCPVDKGDLVASIGTSYPKRGFALIHVGTDHWAPTEYGSNPHWIISHGFWYKPERPWPLRNEETGEVFGPVVWHPGTPAQPFLRPAIHRKRII